MRSARAERRWRRAFRNGAACDTWLRWIRILAERVTPAADAAPADLYWFHRSHGEEANAYSPCMHRGDAETVSFSWTVVTREEIRFTYSPAAPCQWSASEQRILMRAA